VLKRADFTSDSRDLAVGATLLASLVVLSIWTAHGSYLYIESGMFLHNLLSPRPLLARIFDPTGNEIVGYHARELSYFFNWIDARFIYDSTRLGYPHFFSLLHIMGISLIAGCNVVFARRRFGKTFTRVAVLLSALFLTAPAVFLSNNFLRTSKIVAGTALFFLLWRLTDLVSRPMANVSKERLAKLAAGIGVLGSVMALCDEQGVFLLTLCLGFAVIVCASRPRGKRFESACVAGAIFASLALYACYDLYWGPKIIAAFGNDPAVYHYQKVNVAAALADGPNLKEAWGLLMDALGFQFGSLDFITHAASGNRAASFYPFSSAIALALLAGLALPLLSRRGKPRELIPVEAFPLAGALIAAAALVVMFAAMIQRHPPVLWESVRRGYYWIPCAVLLLVASTFAAGYFAKLRGTFVLEASLLGLLLLNVTELPAHRRFLETGLQRIFIGESPALRDCLRRPEIPLADYRLSPSSWKWCADYRDLSAPK
jgi:hypothetical protein